jgi:hypothetical protein
VAPQVASVEVHGVEVAYSLVVGGEVDPAAYQLRRGDVAREAEELLEGAAPVSAYPKDAAHPSSIPLPVGEVVGVVA